VSGDGLPPGSGPTELSLSQLRTAEVTVIT
jgi:hypothetical protein